MKGIWFFLSGLMIVMHSCTLPLIEELNRSEEDKVKKYMKNETFAITEVHEIIEEREGWNMPYTTVLDTLYPISGTFLFETDRDRFNPVTYTDENGAIANVRWELYDEDAEDDEPRLFFYSDEMMGKWEESPFEACQVYTTFDGLTVDEYGETELKLSQNGVEERFGRRSLFITLTLK